MTARRVWVVEAHNGESWWPAETVSLRPAVYHSRAEARRDIRNLQVVGYRLRIRSYRPEGAALSLEGQPPPQSLGHGTPYCLGCDAGMIPGQEQPHGEFCVVVAQVRAALSERGEPSE
jgi:hypothetical protein